VEAFLDGPIEGDWSYRGFTPLTGWPARPQPCGAYCAASDPWM
jgi:hypothetical protein